MEGKRLKIAIMIPVYGYVPAKCFGNIINFILESMKRFQIGVMIVDSTHITKARNTLIENFISLDFDYGLFIDADMFLPPDAIEGLLSHEKDAVSALYFRKDPPYEPVCMKHVGDGKYEMFRELPQQELFEADFTGLGCFLVKKEAALKVAKEKPVFSMENKKDGRVKGEDAIFCEKIKKAGYKIWVSRKVVAGHYGGIVFPPPLAQPE